MNHFTYLILIILVFDGGNSRPAAEEGDNNDYLKRITGASGVFENRDEGLIYDGFNAQNLQGKTENPYKHKLGNTQKLNEWNENINLDNILTILNNNGISMNNDEIRFINNYVRGNSEWMKGGNGGLNFIGNGIAGIIPSSTNPMDVEYERGINAIDDGNYLLMDDDPLGNIDDIDLLTLQKLLTNNANIENIEPKNGIIIVDNIENIQPINPISRNYQPLYNFEISEPDNRAIPNTRFKSDNNYNQAVQRVNNDELTFGNNAETRNPNDFRDFTEDQAMLDEIIKNNLEDLQNLDESSEEVFISKPRSESKNHARHKEINDSETVTDLRFNENNDDVNRFHTNGNVLINEFTKNKNIDDEEFIDELPKHIHSVKHHHTNNSETNEGGKSLMEAIRKEVSGDDVDYVRHNKKTINALQGIENNDGHKYKNLEHANEAGDLRGIITKETNDNYQKQMESNIGNMRNYQKKYADVNKDIYSEPTEFEDNISFLNNYNLAENEHNEEIITKQKEQQNYAPTEDGLIQNAYFKNEDFNVLKKQSTRHKRNTKNERNPSEIKPAHHHVTNQEKIAQIIPFWNIHSVFPNVKLGNNFNGFKSASHSSNSDKAKPGDVHLTDANNNTIIQTNYQRVNIAPNLLSHNNMLLNNHLRKLIPSNNLLTSNSKAGDTKQNNVYLVDDNNNTIIQTNIQGTQSADNKENPALNISELTTNVSNNEEINRLNDTKNTEAKETTNTPDIEIVAVFNKTVDNSQDTDSANHVHIPKENDTENISSLEKSNPIPNNVHPDLDKPANAMKTLDDSKNISEIDPESKVLNLTNPVDNLHNNHNIAEVVKGSDISPRSDNEEILNIPINVSNNNENSTTLNTENMDVNYKQNNSGINNVNEVRHSSDQSITLVNEKEHVNSSKIDAEMELPSNNTSPKTSIIIANTNQDIDSSKIGGILDNGKFNTSNNVDLKTNVGINNSTNNLAVNSSNHNGDIVYKNQKVISKDELEKIADIIEKAKDSVSLNFNGLVKTNPITSNQNSRGVFYNNFAGNLMNMGTNPALNNGGDYKNQQKFIPSNLYLFGRVPQLNNFRHEQKILAPEFNKPTNTINLSSTKTDAADENINQSILDDGSQVGVDPNENKTSEASTLVTSEQPSAAEDPVISNQTEPATTSTELKPPVLVDNAKEIETPLEPGNVDLTKDANPAILERQKRHDFGFIPYTNPIYPEFENKEQFFLPSVENVYPFNYQPPPITLPVHPNMVDADVMERSFLHHSKDTEIDLKQYRKSLRDRLRKRKLDFQDNLLKLSQMHQQHVGNSLVNQKILNIIDKYENKREERLAKLRKLHNLRRKHKHRFFRRPTITEEVNPLIDNDREIMFASKMITKNKSPNLARDDDYKNELLTKIRNINTEQEEEKLIQENVIEPVVEKEVKPLGDVVNYSLNLSQFENTFFKENSKRLLDETGFNLNKTKKESEDAETKIIQGNDDPNLKPSQKEGENEFRENLNSTYNTNIEPAVTSEKDKDYEVQNNAFINPPDMVDIATNLKEPFVEDTNRINIPSANDINDDVNEILDYNSKKLQLEETIRQVSKHLNEIKQKNAQSNSENLYTRYNRGLNAAPDDNFSENNYSVNDISDIGERANSGIENNSNTIATYNNDNQEFIPDTNYYNGLHNSETARLVGNINNNLKTISETSVPSGFNYELPRNLMDLYKNARDDINAYARKGIEVSNKTNGGVNGVETRNENNQDLYLHDEFNATVVQKNIQNLPVNLTQDPNIPSSAQNQNPVIFSPSNAVININSGTGRINQNGENQTYTPGVENVKVNDRSFSLPRTSSNSEYASEDQSNGDTRFEDLIIDQGLDVQRQELVNSVQKPEILDTPFITDEQINRNSSEVKPGETTVLSDEDNLALLDKENRTYIPNLALSDRKNQTKLDIVENNESNNTAIERIPRSNTTQPDIFLRDAANNVIIQSNNQKVDGLNFLNQFMPNSRKHPAIGIQNSNSAINFGQHSAGIFQQNNGNTIHTRFATDFPDQNSNVVYQSNYQNTGAHIPYDNPFGLPQNDDNYMSPAYSYGVENVYPPKFENAESHDVYLNKRPNNAIDGSSKPYLYGNLEESSNTNAHSGNVYENSNSPQTDLYNNPHIDNKYHISNAMRTENLYDVPNTAEAEHLYKMPNAEQTYGNSHDRLHPAHKDNHNDAFYANLIHPALAATQPNLMQPLQALNEQLLHAANLINPLGIANPDVFLVDQANNMLLQSNYQNRLPYFYDPIGFSSSNAAVNFNKKSSRVHQHAYPGGVYNMLDNTPPLSSEFDGGGGRRKHPGYNYRERNVNSDHTHDKKVKMESSKLDTAFGKETSAEHDLDFGYKHLKNEHNEVEQSEEVKVIHTDSPIETNDDQDQGLNFRFPLHFDEDFERELQIATMAPDTIHRPFINNPPLFATSAPPIFYSNPIPSAAQRRHSTISPIYDEPNEFDVFQMIGDPDAVDHEQLEDILQYETSAEPPLLSKDEFRTTSTIDADRMVATATQSPIHHSTPGPTGYPSSPGYQDQWEQLYGNLEYPNVATESAMNNKGSLINANVPVKLLSSSQNIGQVAKSDKNTASLINANIPIKLLSKNQEIVHQGIPATAQSGGSLKNVGLPVSVHSSSQQIGQTNSNQNKGSLINLEAPINLLSSNQQNVITITPKPGTKPVKTPSGGDRYLTEDLMNTTPIDLIDLDQIDGDDDRGLLLHLLNRKLHKLTTDLLKTTKAAKKLYTMEPAVHKPHRKPSRPPHVHGTPPCTNKVRIVQTPVYIVQTPRPKHYYYPPTPNPIHYGYPYYPVYPPIRDGHNVPVHMGNKKKKCNKNRHGYNRSIDADRVLNDTVTNNTFPIVPVNPGGGGIKQDPIIGINLPVEVLSTVSDNKHIGGHGDQVILPVNPGGVINQDSLIGLNAPISVLSTLTETGQPPIQDQGEFTVIANNGTHALLSNGILNLSLPISLLTTTTTNIFQNDKIQQDQNLPKTTISDGVISTGSQNIPTSASNVIAPLINVAAPITALSSSATTQQGGNNNYPTTNSGQQNSAPSLLNVKAPIDVLSKKENVVLNKDQQNNNQNTGSLINVDLPVNGLSNTNQQTVGGNQHNSGKSTGSLINVEAPIKVLSSHQEKTVVIPQANMHNSPQPSTISQQLTQSLNNQPTASLVGIKLPIDVLSKHEQTSILGNIGQLTENIHQRSDGDEDGEVKHEDLLKLIELVQNSKKIDELKKLNEKLSTTSQIYITQKPNDITETPVYQTTEPISNDQDAKAFSQLESLFNKYKQMLNNYKAQIETNNKNQNIEETPKPRQMDTQEDDDFIMDHNKLVTWKLPSQPAKTATFSDGLVKWTMPPKATPSDKEEARLNALKATTSDRYIDEEEIRLKNYLDEFNSTIGRSSIKTDFKAKGNNEAKAFFKQTEKPNLFQSILNQMTPQPQYLTKSQRKSLFDNLLNYLSPTTTTQKPSFLNLINALEGSQQLQSQMSGIWDALKQIKSQNSGTTKSGKNPVETFGTRISKDRGGKRHPLYSVDPELARVPKEFISRPKYPFKEIIESENSDVNNHGSRNSQNLRRSSVYYLPTTWRPSRYYPEMFNYDANAKSDAGQKKRVHYDFTTPRIYNGRGRNQQQRYYDQGNQMKYYPRADFRLLKGKDDENESSTKDQHEHDVSASAAFSKEFNFNADSSEEDYERMLSENSEFKDADVKLSENSQLPDNVENKDSGSISQNVESNAMLAHSAKDPKADKLDSVDTNQNQNEFTGDFLGEVEKPNSERFSREEAFSVPASEASPKNAIVNDLDNSKSSKLSKNHPIYRVFYDNVRQQNAAMNQTEADELNNQTENPTLQELIDANLQKNNNSFAHSLSTRSINDETQTQPYKPHFRNHQKPITLENQAPIRPVLNPSVYAPKINNQQSRGFKRGVGKYGNRADEIIPGKRLENLKLMELDADNLEGLDEELLLRSKTGDHKGEQNLYYQNNHNHLFSSAESNDNRFYKNSYGEKNVNFPIQPQPMIYNNPPSFNNGPMLDYMNPPGYMNPNNFIYNNAPPPYNSQNFKNDHSVYDKQAAFKGGKNPVPYKKCKLQGKVETLSKLHTGKPEEEDENFKSAEENDWQDQNIGRSEKILNNNDENEQDVRNMQVATPLHPELIEEIQDGNKINVEKEEQTSAKESNYNSMDIAPRSGKESDEITVSENATQPTESADVVLLQNKKVLNEKTNQSKHETQIANTKPEEQIPSEQLQSEGNETTPSKPSSKTEKSSSGKSESELLKQFEKRLKALVESNNSDSQRKVETLKSDEKVDKELKHKLDELKMEFKGNEYEELKRMLELRDLSDLSFEDKNFQRKLEQLKLHNKVLDLEGKGNKNKIHTIVEDDSDSFELSMKSLMKHYAQYLRHHKHPHKHQFSDETLFLNGDSLEEYRRKLKERKWRSKFNRHHSSEIEEEIERILKSAERKLRLKYHQHDYESKNAKLKKLTKFYEGILSQMESKKASDETKYEMQNNHKLYLTKLKNALNAKHKLSNNNEMKLNAARLRGLDKLSPEDYKMLSAYFSEQHQHDSNYKNPEMLKELNPELFTAMHPDVLNEIDNEIHPELYKSAHHDYLKERLFNDLYPEEHKMYPADLVKDIQPEVYKHSDFLKEKYNGMHPGFVKEIHPQMYKELYPNNLNEIEPAMYKQLSPELQKELLKALHPELIKEVHPEVYPELLRQLHSEWLREKKFPMLHQSDMNGKKLGFEDSTKSLNALTLGNLKTRTESSTDSVGEQIMEASKTIAQELYKQFDKKFEEMKRDQAYEGIGSNKNPLTAKRSAAANADNINSIRNDVANKREHLLFSIPSRALLPKSVPFIRVAHDKLNLANRPLQQTDNSPQKINIDLNEDINKPIIQTQLESTAVQPEETNEVNKVQFLNEHSLNDYIKMENTTLVSVDESGKLKNRIESKVLIEKHEKPINNLNTKTNQQRTDLNTKNKTSGNFDEQQNETKNKVNSETEPRMLSEESNIETIPNQAIGNNEQIVEESAVENKSTLGSQENKDTTIETPSIEIKTIDNQEVKKVKNETSPKVHSKESRTKASNKHSQNAAFEKSMETNEKNKIVEKSKDKSDSSENVSSYEQNSPEKLKLKEKMKHRFTSEVTQKTATLPKPLDETKKEENLINNRSTERTLKGKPRRKHRRKPKGNVFSDTKISVRSNENNDNEDVNSHSKKHSEPEERDNDGDITEADSREIKQHNSEASKRLESYKSGRRRNKKKRVEDASVNSMQTDESAKENKASSGGVSKTHKSRLKHYKHVKTDDSNKNEVNAQTNEAIPTVRKVHKSRTKYKTDNPASTPRSKHRRVEAFAENEDTEETPGIGGIIQTHSHKHKHKKYRTSDENANENSDRNLNVDSNNRKHKMNHSTEDGDYNSDSNKKHADIEENRRRYRKHKSNEGSSSFKHKHNHERNNDDTIDHWRGQGGKHGSFESSERRPKGKHRSIDGNGNQRRI